MSIKPMDIVRACHGSPLPKSACPSEKTLLEQAQKQRHFGLEIGFLFNQNKSEFKFDFQFIS